MKKHLRRKRSFPLQRSMLAPRARRGQALVELALTLTLLVMLLGAAVDLGLAYKTYQTLTNATAEASTYLSLEPIVNCGAAGCDQIGPANEEARKRFREEQGSTLRGLASTLDLDANGQVDDMSITTNRVQIKVADSSQINVGSSNFALDPNLLPSGGNCEARDKRSYTTTGTVRQCFIVVYATMTYKPFFIKPFVGSEMTITAISVKPIVGSPF